MIIEVVYLGDHGKTWCILNWLPWDKPLPLDP